MIDLKTIRKRAEEAAERAAAASPGPWTIDDEQDDFIVCKPDGSILFDVGWEGSRDGVSPRRPDADSRFVCAARVDVPALSADVLALADEVEWLRAENAGLRTGIKGACATKQRFQSERDIALRKMFESETRADVSEAHAKALRAVVEAAVPRCWHRDCDATKRRATKWCHSVSIVACDQHAEESGLEWGELDGAVQIRALEALERNGGATNKNVST